MLIEVYYERMNYQLLSESEAYGARLAISCHWRIYKSDSGALFSVGQFGVRHGRSAWSLDGHQRDHCRRILLSAHPALSLLHGSSQTTEIWRRWRFWRRRRRWQSKCHRSVLFSFHRKHIHAAVYCFSPPRRENHRLHTKMVAKRISRTLFCLILISSISL